MIVTGIVKACGDKYLEGKVMVIGDYYIKNNVLIVVKGLIAYKMGDEVVISIINGDYCESHKIPVTSISSVIDVDEGAFRV